MITHCRRLLRHIFVCSTHTETKWGLWCNSSERTWVIASGRDIIWCDQQNRASTLGHYELQLWASLVHTISITKLGSTLDIALRHFPTVLHAGIVFWFDSGPLDRRANVITSWSTVHIPLISYTGLCGKILIAQASL